MKLHRKHELANLNPYVFLRKRNAIHDLKVPCSFKNIVPTLVTSIPCIVLISHAARDLLRGADE
jgi:hypothetical protein